MDNGLADRIQNNPQFAILERERNSFAWMLTFIMLGLYFGFILMMAFAPGLMGMTVGGVVTLGFPLGLGVMVVAMLLTGIYVMRANRRYDQLTRAIREGHR